MSLWPSPASLPEITPSPVSREHGVESWPAAVVLISSQKPAWQRGGKASSMGHCLEARPGRTEVASWELLSPPYLACAWGASGQPDAVAESCPTYTRIHRVDKETGSGDRLHARVPHLLLCPLQSRTRTEFRSPSAPQPSTAPHAPLPSHASAPHKGGYGFSGVSASGLGGLPGSGEPGLQSA